MNTAHTGPSRESRARSRRTVRAIAERLLLASSLLLVVLTVVFSTFMSAEKFWQGQAIAIAVKQTEPGLTKSANDQLDDMRKRYDRDHQTQVIYRQVFAGLMSVVMLLTAVCIPIGIWTPSTPTLKAITVTLMAILGLSGLYGLGFAIGCANP